jgi:hypothetical protein
MVFAFGAVVLATAAFFVFSKKRINFGIDLVNYYWHSYGDSRRGVCSMIDLNLVSRSYNLSSSGILDNCARNSDECENKISENNIF